MIFLTIQILVYALIWVGAVIASFLSWAVAQGYFAARPFGILVVLVLETIVVAGVYFLHDPLYGSFWVAALVVAYLGNIVSALIIWANQLGERMARRGRTRL